MSDDQDACAAIRNLLRHHGVPEAPFIDDHVRNVIVQRDALAEALQRLVNITAILPEEFDTPGSAISQARSALAKAKVKP